MSQPLLSLLHPTARVKPSSSFPRGWRAAFDLYLERADHPERIEYVLAVHESRWEGFHVSALADGPQGEEFAAVQWIKNTGRDCAVAQLNCAAAASTGKLLMGVMDDLEPPEHWDTLVQEAFESGCDYPHESDYSGEYVMHLSSGSPSDRELMIAGAITRKRYERYGYILNPQFESMFSDNYFTWQARRDEQEGKCKIITRLDIEFKHNHPLFGRGKPDELYALQNRPEAYREGAATFARLTTGQRVLAVCCPGEVFRHEWVATTYGLLMHIKDSQRFSQIGNHWCHTSNVHSTRIELAASVLSASPRADLVLWLDDDNLLEPGQFDMLVQDLDAHPELSGVVGWCWCDPADPQGLKNKPLEMSCGRQGEALKCMRFTLEDWNKARASDKWLVGSDDIAPDAFWSGFPVVLMRYEALEKLGALVFAPMVIPEVHHGFTSEDTSFFYRAHAAGLKFAVDLRVKVPHLKVRNIEPQYLSESERGKVLESQGKGGDALRTALQTARYMGDWPLWTDKRGNYSPYRTLTCNEQVMEAAVGAD
jgi:hypothetical protein